MTNFYCIAEIAQAHDGSLGILHSYIDALSKLNVQAIKFQTHIAEAESSVHEPFRVNFSYEDQTRYDYWRRMEFTPEQWIGIGEHCKQVGLDFISSPFSLKAVDVLEQANVQKYKLGSGEVSNHLLIERVCRTGKPIIISSGLSNLIELDEAVKIIESFGNELSILQCTTAYPTKPEQWALNQIKLLKDRYPHSVGFSDHSGDIFAAISAANWGATVFEFHVTFDKRMFGPDAPASLTLDQIERLVTGLAQVELALEHPLLNKGESEDVKVLKDIFEKSLAVNRDLLAGEVLIEEHLETKKPAGMGIPAKDYRKVIGKKLDKPLRQWDFLDWKFLLD